MNDILAALSQLTGLQPATLVLLGGVIITVSNALSRLIPDDATGFLGFVRSVTKLIGVNISSRVTSGVTISDVARTLLAAPDSKQEVVDQLKATGVLPDPNVGISGVTRSSNGRRAKANSPWLVTLGTFILVILVFALSGCATDRQVGDYVCTHQISLTAAANAALRNAESIKDPALRAATIEGANATLALVAACPPTDGPIGVN